jgi:HD superfamily phosphohydrolase
MAISNIRALQTKWLRNADLQSAINAAFERIGFSASYVSQCINAAENGDASRKTKFIKDNVWGMVSASAQTMRLLDCPVVQRLRGIKQLGLSYLTYPSAEHSRFVHSLGVGHVVSKFLEAIDSRSSEGDQPGDGLHYIGREKLHPLLPDDMIHAAILHDVGHMPFSHATESVIKGREDLFTCGNQTVSEFFGEVEIELSKNIQLSEALSILIILSQRFSEFYRGYVRRDLEDPNALLRIACLICGLPPEPRLSGVTEVISAAAVDADKIDYISRDARACGIPVGLDVSRVFLRSGFVQATRDVILKADLKDDPASEEIIFVVNASGMDTLDEIMQARAALYQRVYLHAVTRTAESVLAKVLAANAESKFKVDTLSDALGLWSTCDEALLDQVIKAKDPVVQKLGVNLKNRWLPKKALAFSAATAKMHMPLRDIFPYLSATEFGVLEAQVLNTRLEELSQKNIAGEDGARLEAEIFEEANKIAAKLPQVAPKNSLEVLTVIGSAYMQQTRRDCVVLFNGDLVRTSKVTSAKEQQDAFDIFKAVGYVMCDPAWRTIVMIAARSILSKSRGKPINYRLQFSHTDGEEGLAASSSAIDVHIVHRMGLDAEHIVRQTGLKKHEIAAAVAEAQEVGYFDDAPLLAPSVDPGRQTIREIAKKLESFQGERSWRVKDTTVAAFLNQFPPRLRDEMIDMLSKKMTFFTSEELERSILDPMTKLGKADLVALSPNSGTDVRIRLERAAKGRSEFNNLKFAKEIRSTLAEETEQPLILVDDNISSATQARAQFLLWCDKDQNEWPEECRGEDGIFDAPLEPEVLARFKRRPFKIAVAAGRQEAAEVLRPFVEDLGFINFLGVQYGKKIEAEGWSQDLKTFLEDVGCSLIAWTKYRKEISELTVDEQKYCLDRAFGYGNVGGLVATASNVPTATVTALWSPGLFRSTPWMPLLIRQNKLRHFVIA